MAQHIRSEATPNRRRSMVPRILFIFYVFGTARTCVVLALKILFITGGKFFHLTIEIMSSQHLPAFHALTYVITLCVSELRIHQCLMHAWNWCGRSAHEPDGDIASTYIMQSATTHEIVSDLKSDWLCQWSNVEIKNDNQCFFVKHRTYKQRLKNSC